MVEGEIDPALHDLILTSMARDFQRRAILAYCQMPEVRNLLEGADNAEG